MAEELAFARKASGLVRGLSMMDAFMVGFMNQGVVPSIYLIFSLGLGVFLGGNLVIASLISLVMAGIGFPLVWGILGGSMPRSGGEYVYNSRIIHPIFGIASSFGDAVIWLMWIYVLAPLCVDPGLTVMFRYMGWTSAADWLVSSVWITLAIATLFNVVSLLFVIFGMKVFAQVQKVIFSVAMVGAVIIAVVLTVTSRATFTANWDAQAVATDSPKYHEFIAKIGELAGQPMPAVWNWGATIGCMVIMSWLFAYAYSISYIAGEVKRPDKTIIWANLFAIVVPCAYMIWIGLAINHSVGYQFIQAASWQELNYGLELNMPYSTDFISMAVYCLGVLGTGGKIAAFLMGMSYLLFTVWWLSLSYLAFPRILFAWGMDRMGPKWFTDINPRFASPVKNYILCFVLSEILLVIYSYSLFAVMQNTLVTGMQITSVFLPVAVAALLFPYRKRVKGVWDSSPYKTWKFLGLPVVVWGALISIAYLLILLYVFIFNKAAQQFNTAGIVLFVAVWIVGIIWYLVWSRVSKRQGVDVSLTYGELPPE